MAERTRKDRDHRDDASEIGPDPEGRGSLGNTEERSSENRREGLEEGRERAREQHRKRD